MIKKTRYHKTELAVIGAGISGCAASVFALNRGINITQIGNTGALAFTSGYLDLLGVQQEQVVQQPWEELSILREAEPQHPYALVPDADIREAFREFIEALDEMGLPYTRPGMQNRLALLPTGAVKPTYSVPETMSQAEQALQEQAKTLVIDFDGLQGYSAREIAGNLSLLWPQLTVAKVDFPDVQNGSPLYPEVMARSLEVPETRKALAERVKAVAGDAEYIALPAILGIHRSSDVHRDFERETGLPVFEIPTIPPAVAGIRLRELFEQQLTERGADVITQYKVRHVEFKKDSIELSYDDHFGKVVIVADQVLLASGRFLSGGLNADRERIRESLFDLPVWQPGQRDDWFHESYFDPNGHAVNRAGLMVNKDFQVVDHNQKIIDPRLYASGIVLAHQDWIRQRSGAGIAVASAYRVINRILEEL